jgi:SEC-C motif
MIEYVAPPSADQFFRMLAVRATEYVEHPLEMTIGGYTVEQFRAFFRELYRRAACNQVACWLSSNVGSRSLAVGSTVLRISRSVLRDALCLDGLLTEESFGRILTDTTYDSRRKHTDVFFQPLLPVTDDEFLVSPMLITTTNWERNLQRLWALKDPGAYGSAVQAACTNLALTVRDWFAGASHIATANRILRLGGSNATDVDVAVCDPAERFLFLAQVKWLIPPAEPWEVRRADDDLRKGIEQARVADVFVRGHPQEAARLLFPDFALDIGPETRIQSAVISRNHPGSADIAADDVPIIDYALAEDAMNRLPTAPRLEKTVARLIALQAQPRRGRDYEVAEAEIEIAGYRFRGEAFTLLKPAAAFPEYGADRHGMRVGRNDRCPCGSGKKYKRCCGA